MTEQREVAADAHFDAVRRLTALRILGIILTLGILAELADLTILYARDRQAVADAHSSATSETSETAATPKSANQEAKPEVQTEAADDLSAVVAALEIPQQDLAAEQLDQEQAQAVGQWLNARLTGTVRASLEVGQSLQETGELVAGASSTLAKIPDPEPPLPDVVPPAVVDVPEFAQGPLVITNPEENSGPVHFLIDGQLASLSVGESRQFGTGAIWTIDYHPGGERQDVRETVGPGEYEFQAGSGGWKLAPQP